ncbi:MAG: 2-oxo acid dehydrogenase subunit E2 [Actinomycetota bacterium]|nr:2-oxo acid dehydrogenase subunit E2 [Actinomycetota bacterium]
MAIEFQMPKLGLTMEAGTILEWLVANETEVTEGMPVLLIETDKVETEVESSGSGRLHQTGVVGESYPCGTPIGWFLTLDESVPWQTPESSVTPPRTVDDAQAPRAKATPAAGPQSVRDGRLLVSPNARRVAVLLGVELAALTGSGPGGRIVSEDVEAAAAAGLADSTILPSGPSAAAGVVAATAAARSLAHRLGVDLASVAVTGADPRVTRNDVAHHVREQLAVPDGSITTAAPSAPLLQTPSSVIPMRGMRRTIADRMHASLQEMAQLTLTVEVVMDAVVSDRERRKTDGSPPGYTDYIIAAVATALVRHPLVNSQVTSDGIALLPEINVGMAVALQEGLIVPVIHDAETLGLSDLAVETTRLVAAARDSSLSLSELEGGTFSVTTLGMFGVDGFTPVINPPNTAILGVGRLREDMGWNDRGKPVRRTALTLSLTWDHRAFDGAPAAQFAAEVRDLLEAGEFPD